jgi:hypothetical protein
VFVAGGNAGAFDNFWLAEFDFTLPSNATNIRLMYSGLDVDDRAVLELNGTTIAAFGINQTASVCTDGFMVLTDGGPNNPYTFCSGRSGIVTSGFNVGGTNTLLAIINNTNRGIAGDLSVPFAGGNATRFGISGSLTFTETPEPRGWWLLAVGMLILTGVWRRGRRPGQE